MVSTAENLESMVRGWPRISSAGADAFVKRTKRDCCFGLRLAVVLVPSNIFKRGRRRDNSEIAPMVDRAERRGTPFVLFAEQLSVTPHSSARPHLHARCLERTRKNQRIRICAPPVHSPILGNLGRDRRLSFSSMAQKPNPERCQCPNGRRNRAHASSSDSGVPPENCTNAGSAHIAAYAAKSLC